MDLQMLTINKSSENAQAKRLCDEFLNANRPKYIMGRNPRSSAVGELVDFDGYIDDFTKDTTYQGKPVCSVKDLPEGALILITSICNPFSAQRVVSELGHDSIDYFSFVKYSHLNIPENEFQPEFSQEYATNKAKYEAIYDRLSDTESKIQFQKILNFRLNQDLSYLQGFINNEKNQYFEDFLNLKAEGEIFVDAGGYDGLTTIEFIKRCPNYQAVHIFEPELTNLKKAKQNLSDCNSIEFYPHGLYSKKTSFNFSSGGSASKISQEGEVEIRVDALDNILDTPVTFLKMDIEGAEIEAIKGARELISKYKPKLAISAYHKTDDFWKIPEAVFSIRDDYQLYLRHYMEGVTETVMFFV